MVAGIRLPEHSHCKFCGDPIPFGDEFCDNACRADEATRVKKERNKEIAFWGSAGVVIVIILAIRYVMML